jgi:hypothetical protein
MCNRFGNYLEFIEQGCAAFGREKSPTVSAINALGWPSNSLCKESENGSTNNPTTLVK